MGADDGDYLVSLNGCRVGVFVDGLADGLMQVSQESMGCGEVDLQGECACGGCVS